MCACYNVYVRVYVQLYEKKAQTDKQTEKEEEGEGESLLYIQTYMTVCECVRVYMYICLYARACLLQS